MVIPADKTIIPLKDDRYSVSAAFIQERYQLERTLRMELEKCHAED